MSVVAELKRQYQELFSPLIEAYTNLSTQEKGERKKICKLVQNLLNNTSNHGEIIQLYNEGFSLQDIGNYQGVSRERIRQIIKKYEGYYIAVGSREWTFNELEKLNISQGKITKQLPSNQDLERYHPLVVQKSLESLIISSFLVMSSNIKFRDFGKLNPTVYLLSLLA